jgi:hypothetical protein
MQDLSLIDYIFQYKAEILAGLLTVSEVMALNPKWKSSSIIQFVYSVLKLLKNKVRPGQKTYSEAPSWQPNSTMESPGMPDNYQTTENAGNFPEQNDNFSAQFYPKEQLDYQRRGLKSDLSISIDMKAGKISVENKIKD